MKNIYYKTDKGYYYKKNNNGCVRISQENYNKNIKNKQTKENKPNKLNKLNKLNKQKLNNKKGGFSDNYFQYWNNLDINTPLTTVKTQNIFMNNLSSNNKNTLKKTLKNLWNNTSKSNTNNILRLRKLADIQDTSSAQRNIDDTIVSFDCRELNNLLQQTEYIGFSNNVSLYLLSDNNKKSILVSENSSLTDINNTNNKNYNFIKNNNTQQIYMIDLNSQQNNNSEINDNQMINRFIENIYNNYNYQDTSATIYNNLGNDITLYE
jgi:hypothetical protein